MSTRLIEPSPRGRRRSPPVPGVLGPFVLVLLTGCATDTSLGRGLVSTETNQRAPGHYAQTTDSATSGCLRNPSCYTTAPGEESIIPWVSRTVEAARTATTVAMMLQEADIQLVEQTLTRCAREANEKVNKEDKELQGQEPTWEECKKVVRREGSTEVTRAMELGAKKHTVALDCVRAAFAERFARNVSVEPTYQKDFSTRAWRWIDPEKVKEWLQLGLTSQLWGALVPDIVLHATGNPNQVQRVYDFKFPCPPAKEPHWGQYDKGHPHFPKDQKRMYREALLGGRGEPGAVTVNGIK